MSVLQQNTLKQIPTNITSALARFNLHPSTTVYATCPSCSCLYKPVFKPGLSTAEYPSHWTNKPKPWLPICNQPLLQPSSTGHCSLIKPYVYHHFHDFVASLLARSEIDAIINEPCDRLMGSLDQPAPLNSKDIWDSEFLRTFQGPLPRALFIDRKGKSCLVFSLNIDFFNVKGVSAYKEKLLLAVSSPVPASISHLAYVTSPRICSLQASCQDPMNPLVIN